MWEDRTLTCYAIGELDVSSLALSDRGCLADLGRAQLETGSCFVPLSMPKGTGAFGAPLETCCRTR